MKKIDWAKPIKVNGKNGKVLAVFKATAFVTWDNEFYATLFDEYGRRTDGLGYKRDNPEVENIPEELYLRLYRRDGVWSLDGAGCGKIWGSYAGKNALPRDMWVKYYGHRVEDKDHILVKAPS